MDEMEAAEGGEDTIQEGGRWSSVTRPLGGHRLDYVIRQSYTHVHSKGQSSHTTTQSQLLRYYILLHQNPPGIHLECTWILGSPCGIQVVLVEFQAVHVESRQSIWYSTWTAQIPDSPTWNRQGSINYSHCNPVVIEYQGIQYKVTVSFIFLYIASYADMYSSIVPSVTHLPYDLQLLYYYCSNIHI